MNVQVRRCSQLGRTETKVPRCPCRRPLVRPQIVAAAAAQRTAEEYSQLLLSSGDDWTKTLELITEVNVLRIDVEPRALESAVVSLASGGQWQRAEALYRQLQSRGHTPSSGTTTALVAGLAGSQQGQRAASLLGELGGLGAHGGTDGGLGPAYNLVTRALARQGLLDEAYDILTRMMKAEMLVEASTFTCVASSCMNAERTELAEEVLEMRDYL